MSMPFYVSPEQVMKDRADYARKGIARGRSLVAFECEPGIVIVADNPSRTLSKISEIYDRIAFAAVGLYSEYQLLRIAGVRHADMGASHGAYAIERLIEMTGQPLRIEAGPFKDECAALRLRTTPR